MARISVDPVVMAGKPILTEIRLTVDFIVGLLAQGWSDGDILRNYPGIQIEDIRACLSYARERLAGERVFPVQV